jgi:hypothetical protein
MRRAESGLTLMEVLIAVSLLSLLSVGMLLALRVGLAATEKANARLIDNRRVAGAQRILEQEIAGFMPVMAHCAKDPDPQSTKTRMPFFQGEPQAMRFVSTYSLQQAWRGMPQVLEFLVTGREDGRGVRLIVNEHLYTGPLGTGLFCLGLAPNPALGGTVPAFPPIEVGAGSFVLADKLAFCRFSYLAPVPPPALPQQWVPQWILPYWPLGVRVEMAPFADDASRLRPLTVTQRIQVHRAPDLNYDDR